MKQIQPNEAHNCTSPKKVKQNEIQPKTEVQNKMALERTTKSENYENQQHCDEVKIGDNSPKELGEVRIHPPTLTAFKQREISSSCP